MAKSKATEPAPRKKRGRPSLADKSAEDGSRNNEQPDDNPRPRKRGRPSLTDKRAETVTENDGPQQQPMRRKRGRPSLQGVAPSEAQNKKETAKARKPGNGEGSTKPVAGQEKRRRPRPSGGEGSSKATSRVQSQEPKRRRSSQTVIENDSQTRDDEDEPPASPAKPYIHIAPGFRRVRQSTIDAKWQPLAPPALAAATTLLELAQHPVLQRMSATHQRRTHADTALRLVSHRIVRKIQRGLPFPPAAAAASAADELDFEAVLDGRAAVERQLEPTLDAVELLERERKRVEAELERDYAMLRDLEARARAKGRETQGLLKKAHVLAPEAKGVKEEEDDDDKEMTFGSAQPAAPGNAFKDIDDVELQDLAMQLGGHVESIRANLQQAEGVAPQLDRGRGALRAVLFEHLDPAQYDKVVLG